MASSLIEWTDATWNPVTGCTKVSLGCKNCYAERMARRLQAMGHPRYRNGFELTLHDSALDLPKTWRSPQRSHLLARPFGTGPGQGQHTVGTARNRGSATCSWCGCYAFVWRLRCDDDTDRGFDDAL